MNSITLLTGGSGFIGRQILNVLKARGHKVRLVLRDGCDLDVKNIDSVIRTQDLFLESADWWVKVCEGVDTLIHAAWYAKPGAYLQSEKNIECLIGTLNLAKGASVAGVKRVVGIGTCFEYQMHESPLSIDNPLMPLNLYAATKTSTYLTLSQFFKDSSTSFVWCRLFYLFGDGEDSQRFVPYLRAKLSSGEVVELTSGTQIRDFLDVKIAAQEIVDIGESDHIGAANICSGIPISIHEFSKKIANEYGRADLLKFGVRKPNLFDPTYVVGIPHFPKKSPNDF